jgi:lactate dehydrogenase-like 2-hydroxyacid dehydrogenase
MSDAKPDIVTLEAFLPFVEQWLDEAFTVHRVWQAPDRDAALDGVRDKAIGIAAFGHNKVDGALLDRLPRARIVSLMSVGYDAIDIAAASARGVAITNTPDVLTDDVADLAMALTIAASRQVVAGDRYVRSGAWLTGNMALAQSITGKTLGILGMGRIGSAIAHRAEAMKMNVIYGVRAKKADAPWRFSSDLIELAEASDILVVAVPGGDATRRLVDAKVIDALGPSGILVNISRGSVVDESALIDALRMQRLSGAALDVFADEPRVPQALIDMESVVLQPHVGSATLQTRERMGRLMLDNLLCYFAGRPLLTPISSSL